MSSVLTLLSDCTFNVEQIVAHKMMTRFPRASIGTKFANISEAHINIYVQGEMHIIKPSQSW
jgi:hypothetical protein